MIQLSVVLKHLAKYRPNWNVDVRCGRGKHTALIGLCRRVYHDGEPDPTGPYDSILELGWWENYNRYPDKPNSKITNCLHEVFGLAYDPELERYTVNVGDDALAKCTAWYDSIGSKRGEDGRYDVFLLHYEGNTSPNRKNLNVHQASALCEHAKDLGLIPVILDWDKRSPLPDGKTIFNPGCKKTEEGPDLWGNIGTGDAEMITALISLASLYVGIDSGPGKCASATETPTLIAWLQLHPMQFHDPAPNTTHLLPDTWDQQPPCEHPDCRDFFKRKYQYLVYGTESNGEHALTEQAMTWMRQALGVELPADKVIAGVSLTYRWGFWLPRFHDLFCFWTIIEDVLLRDGYKTALRPKKVRGMEYVVDVGSCIGAFARLWHKRSPEAKIACVEMHPTLAAATRANVGDFAKVIPKACYYPQSGPMRLLDCLTPKSVNVGDSRLIDWAGLQRGFPQWYTLRDEVETLTLEDICKLCEFPRIDVLKLDCEGCETNILRYCDLSRIGTIFVESHDPDAWRSLMDARFRGWDTGHMHKSEDGRFEILHLISPNSPK